MDIIMQLSICQKGKNEFYIVSNGSLLTKDYEITYIYK